MKKRRGFVQLAILHLLREEPMHGYQIMKELEERSSGTYRASAGTIYPALQDLLDNEMVHLLDETDKKVYALNENGAKRLAEYTEKKEREFWLEWKERQTWRNSKESVQLKEALSLWEDELRKTIRGIHKKPEQTIQLVHFIEESTERLKKEFK